MQTDFFNMDAAREIGEARTSGARKGDAELRDADRSGGDPTVNRSFAQALQAAADRDRGEPRRQPGTGRDDESQGQEARGRKSSRERTGEAAAAAVAVMVPGVPRSRVTAPAMGGRLRPAAGKAPADDGGDAGRPAGAVNQRRGRRTAMAAVDGSSGPPATPARAMAGAVGAGATVRPSPAAPALAGSDRDGGAAASGKPAAADPVAILRASAPTVITAPEAVAPGGGQAAPINVRVGRQPRPVSRSRGEAAGAKSRSAAASVGAAVARFGNRVPARAASGEDMARRAGETAPAPIDARRSRPKGPAAKAAAAEGASATAVKSADGEAPVAAGVNRENPDRSVTPPGSTKVESAAYRASAPADGGARPAAPSEIMHQIAEKAAILVKTGEQRIRIQLNPESLGHIELNVSTEHQQVTIRMRVSSPMTRELMEQHIGQLKVDLGNQGLTVDRLELDLFSNTTAFGQGDRQSAGDGGGAFSRRRAAHPPLVAAAAEDLSPAAWEPDTSSTLVGVFA